MNLVLDIGNSQVKLAWFRQGVLTGNLRIGTAEFLKDPGVAFRQHAENAILCSVAKGDQGIRELLDRKFSYFLILDAATPLPFRVLYDSPRTLGHDRIAAACGAKARFPGFTVLVIDLGTAITIDIITSSGDYLGGNISPGLTMRFRALHGQTAGLPLVASDGSFPLFGTGTQTAIKAGVQQGILYEIKGYIRGFRRKYPEGHVVLTGGDAAFFAGRIRPPVPVFPFLVLEGLNNILEFNAKRSGF